MPCLSPITLTATPKTPSLSVPCGKCAGCLTARRNEWTFRLFEESKNHLKTCFLTLTYNDDNLEYLNNVATINKATLQKFIKRLRKNIKFRYYAVGEYGSNTMRPHYHLIIFGFDNQSEKIVLDSWKLGNITLGTLTPASIHYTAKYHVNKTNYPEGANKPFALMSLKPAIGFSYIEKAKSFHNHNIEHSFYMHNGIKNPLPRYYKKMLYSQLELKQIAKKSEQKCYESFNQAVSDFERLRPTENFFQDEQNRKNQYQKTFKSKSNQKNLL